MSNTTRIDEPIVTRALLFAIALLLATSSWSANDTVDSVLVLKSENRLYLLSRGIRVRAFDVAFGRNPNGHKQREGDQRTPEGSYVLDYKNSDSAFYKSIRISYPNDEDRAAAARRGVRPGGMVMIHGQPNGYQRRVRSSRPYNWTNGCIAVSNSEMDEIWRLVKVGTPIEIRP